MSESKSEESTVAEKSKEKDKAWNLEAFREELLQNEKAREALDMANRVASGDKKTMDSKFTKQDILDALLLTVVENKLMKVGDVSKESDKNSKEGETSTSNGAEIPPPSPQNPSTKDSSSSTQNSSTQNSSSSTQNSSSSAQDSSSSPAPTGQGQTGSGSVNQKSGTAQKVCRDHKYRNCRKGDRCNFEHPQKCPVIVKYGLQKFNSQGCNPETCNRGYHPRVCFFSMKFKSCKKEGCKKLHLPGTKREFLNKSNQKSDHHSSPSPWSNPGPSWQGFQGSNHSQGLSPTGSEAAFLEKMQQGFLKVMEESFKQFQRSQSQQSPWASNQSGLVH